MVESSRVQIEIDLTMEYQNMITVFEAKNNYSENFYIFQLFNPYKYYLEQLDPDQISSLTCCYLVQEHNKIRFYLYKFNNPDDVASIYFLRNAEYQLVER